VREADPLGYRLYPPSHYKLVFQLPNSLFESAIPLTDIPAFESLFERLQRLSKGKRKKIIFHLIQLTPSSLLYQPPEKPKPPEFFETRAQSIKGLGFYFYLIYLIYFLIVDLILLEIERLI